MPAYNVTGDYGSATVTGTAPFTLGQTGGENGGLHVLNANGSLARVAVAPETGSTVFADNDDGRATLNAIIADANDEAAG